MKELSNFESILFEYIDKWKFLFFPEQWSTVLLDYSKNEILTLFLIYRNKKVNMTEIAEYIHAPLNTATGVATRLEKQGLVVRTRDLEDRRVVKITLTTKGEDEFTQAVGQLQKYFNAIYETLDEQEKQAVLSIAAKTIKVLSSGSLTQTKQANAKKVRKILIE